MKTYQAVTIIGMMGSGKTSVAKRLANKLHTKHIDTDSEIKKISDMSVKGLLKNQDEQRLQLLEYQIIKKHSNENCIISTGDYTVMNTKAWQYLMTHTLTIWINIGPHQLIKRLKANENRPFLDENTNLQELKQLYNTRKKKYEQAQIQIRSLNAKSLGNLIDLITLHISKERENEITPQQNIIHQQ